METMETMDPRSRDFPLLGLMAILAFHALFEDSMGPHQFQLHLVILRQRPRGARGETTWASFGLLDCKKHEYFSRRIEKPSMDACEVLNLQQLYSVFCLCHCYADRLVYRLLWGCQLEISPSSFALCTLENVIRRFQSNWSKKRHAQGWKLSLHLPLIRLRPKTCLTSLSRTAVAAGCADASFDATLHHHSWHREFQCRGLGSGSIGCGICLCRNEWIWILRILRTVKSRNFWCFSCVKAI